MGTGEKKLRTEYDVGRDKLSRLEAVVEDSLLEELPTVDVYVSTISDRKLTSDIILRLNRVLPVPSLQHLKRIHGNRILLCKVEGRSVEEMRQELENRGFVMDGLSGMDKVSVPSRQPATRRQYEGARTVWVCNFHENKYLEKILSPGAGFSEVEVRQAERWMGAAAEAARRSDGERCGCAIVDPSTATLIAVAGDRRRRHPLGHCAMVAVDLVARSQGGAGVWHPVSPFDYHIAGADAPRRDDTYLCTGYDVYLTREPCVMCAMALVHSRVRTVFYAVSCPRRGALGTLTKLHTVTALNHHYRVFRGLLSEQCSDL